MSEVPNLGALRSYAEHNFKGTEAGACFYVSSYQKVLNVTVMFPKRAK